MSDEEVNYYCFFTERVLQEAREPFYTQGSVGDNLNPSLLLILELSNVNPRRREEDKVFLSYTTNSVAIDLGYRGDQIDTPNEVESGKIQDEIIDMLDQIVQIEPVLVNGEDRTVQLVKAAHRKHQDEIQDIVIVTPEEDKHNVKGELVKAQLTEEIDVMNPEEMLNEFREDSNCNID